jgi:flagellar motor switch protein FliN
MSEASKPTETSVFQKALEEVQDFLDVPVRISIKLGGRNMKIREILQLKKDSIVELSKSAGENVDIYVNGRLLGFGEVLEMEGSAGVRFTDFHTPS